MSITTILKYRAQSEREAAIALDRAIEAVNNDNIETLKDIKFGVERTSWYSSCFFEKYAETCSELKKEDKRMIKAIKEIFKKRNIIEFIILLYIQEEMKHFNDKKVQSLDKIFTQTLASYKSAGATKMAMATTLSILITNSVGFKNDILPRVNKYSLAVITALSFYGKVQEAALKARRLRSLYPSLYSALYQSNIEMLYFLISDKIDKALLNSIGLRGEEKFISIIKNLYY